MVLAGNVEVDQCLYCEEKVPRNQRASHKGSKHQRLDFECRHCVKQCPFLSDLIEHLKVRTFSAWPLSHVLFRFLTFFSIIPRLRMSTNLQNLKTPMAIQCLSTILSRIWLSDTKSSCPTIFGASNARSARIPNSRCWLRIATR